MTGGVTCHMLPHLPGVTHLHVNRPLIIYGGRHLINMEILKVPGGLDNVAGKSGADKLNS